MALVASAEHTTRIGIFGGTFDPIHIGHLIVAEETRSLLSLDRVIFVPARVSPLKMGDGTLFSAQDRLAMVELATADNPHFEVSSIDIERHGPSFTVDTLRMFQDHLGSAAQLFFVMGMDSLKSLALWREPEEIIRLARIAAVSRPESRVDWSQLERLLPGVRDVTDIVSTLAIGISSTDIRTRLCNGMSVRYLVPRSVEKFMSESLLSQSQASGE
jgi:nicotinate-nucleotide adenylyltransferase